MIRLLDDETLKLAIELKILCWTEELAGCAENTLQFTEEYPYWLEWMHTAEANNDYRILIGDFEDHTGRLMGVAFASIAEVSDAPLGAVELNGLWVYPEHRGKYVSHRLIKWILNAFNAKGYNQMVVYNHHNAPSNALYQKLGMLVIKNEIQMDGKLPVDIFVGDYNLMLTRLKS